MHNLDEFDGVRWRDGGIRLGGSERSSISRRVEAAAGWRETLRVTLRRMRTRDVLGAGTTLAVEDSARLVAPAGEPGVWRSQSDFRAGDSYTVRAYVPRPRPDQLAESSAASTRDASPTSP